MYPYYNARRLNTNRLRLAIFCVNFGLVATLSLISAICYIVYRIFYYSPIVIMSLWCIYVQFYIRNKAHSEEAMNRAKIASNIAWGCFGTVVMASQFATPIVNFIYSGTFW